MMNVSNMRSVMSNEGVLFSFSGMISQSLVSFMVETGREQFEYKIEDSKIIHKMFIVAIEQLQNIMSYSRDKDITDANKYVSPGLFLIGYDSFKEKYYINSSNEICDDDKEIVSKKIDFINSLERTELKKYLRDKLRSAEDKHQRGAGVGFIEMAKRSSEKLEYNFETVDGKLYFHILTYI